MVDGLSESARALNVSAAPPPKRFGMGHLLLAGLLAAVSPAAAQLRTTELVCSWHDRVRPGMSGVCRGFRAVDVTRIGRACTCTTAHGTKAGRIIQNRRALRMHRTKEP